MLLIAKARYRRTGSDKSASVDVSSLGSKDDMEWGLPAVENDIAPLLVQFREIVAKHLKNVPNRSSPEAMALEVGLGPKFVC